LLFIITCLTFSKETVKIAVVLGLSGREASGWEVDALLGIKLATQEWNNKKNQLLNKPIQLLIYDNQTDKIKATEVTAQAKEDGAIAIIGSRWSSITLPIAFVAQKYKIPLMAPSSGAKGITEVGNCIFRISWMATYPSKLLAWYANNKFHEDAIIIKDIENESSTTVAESFEMEYSKLRSNKKITSLIISQNTVDFTEQLSMIKEKKPGVVFLAISGNRAELLFKQAEKLKMNITWLTDDSVGPKTIPSDLKYSKIYAAAMYYPDKDNLRLQKTITNAENLSNKLNLKPKNIYTSDVFPLFYDGASLLYSAIENSNSLNSKNIVLALSKINYEGITGLISYDENRNPNRDVYIMIAEPENDVFEYIEKITMTDSTYHIKNMKDLK